MLLLFYEAFDSRTLIGIQHQDVGSRLITANLQSDGRLFSRFNHIHHLSINIVHSHAIDTFTFNLHCIGCRVRIKVNR